MLVFYEIWIDYHIARGRLSHGAGGGWRCVFKCSAVQCVLGAWALCYHLVDRLKELMLAQVRRLRVQQLNVKIRFQSECLSKNWIFHIRWRLVMGWRRPCAYDLTSCMLWDGCPRNLFWHHIEQYEVLLFHLHIAIFKHCQNWSLIIFFHLPLHVQFINGLCSLEDVTSFESIMTHSRTSQSVATRWTKTKLYWEQATDPSPVSPYRTLTIEIRHFLLFKHCHLVTKYRKGILHNSTKLRFCTFSFNKSFQYGARNMKNLEKTKKCEINYKFKKTLTWLMVNQSSWTLTWLDLSDQPGFFAPLAFIRALMALALISNSRSSSCLMEGWLMAAGRSTESAVAVAAGTFTSCASVFSSVLEPEERAKISLTLLSMSLWTSFFASAGLLLGLLLLSPAFSTAALTAGSSFGPSMSLSSASALMLSTSLSSPEPPPSVDQNTQTFQTWRGASQPPFIKRLWEVLSAIWLIITLLGVLGFRVFFEARCGVHIIILPLGEKMKWSGKYTLCIHLKKMLWVKSSLTDCPGLLLCLCPHLQMSLRPLDTKAHRHLGTNSLNCLGERSIVGFHSYLPISEWGSSLRLNPAVPSTAFWFLPKCNPASQVV